MQMYTGFVTPKLQESKAFYTQYFDFETMYEGDWFVLLKKGPYELGFLKPEMPGQHRLFRPVFKKGAWLALEVEDVDAEYERLTRSHAPVLTAPETEPWGDRHFVMKDPNGMGVDVYTRVPIEQDQM
jgi:catechol 2,3-dioxygenase-like lactoylglutathione lyase family enzyme